MRGDDPLRIRYDAGHRDFNTTQGYIRSAQAFSADTFGDAFEALPALGGEQNARAIRTHRAKFSGIWCEGGLVPHSLSATGT